VGELGVLQIPRVLEERRWWDVEQLFSVATTVVLSGFGSGFGLAEVAGLGCGGRFESSFEDFRTLGATLREFQEHRERGRRGAG